MDRMVNYFEALKLTGEHKGFYTSGEPFKIERYVNGLRHGECKMFAIFPPGRRMLSIATFHMGNVVGKPIHKELFPDGTGLE